MDPRRFDELTKAVGQRAVSRRSALLASVVGMGTGFALRGRTASAQEATPQSSGSGADYQPLAGEHEALLFVQTFAKGELSPKTGSEGNYTLVLSEGSGLTLYLSDRPNRAVGSVTNAQFIDMFNLTPADPPNAALVTQGDAGDQVLVVELITAASDGASGTMTYEVQILTEADVDMEFRGTYHRDPSGLDTLGQSSLFIDDFLCGDHQGDCYTLANDTDVGSLGKFGFRWCIGTSGGNPMSCCPSEGCVNLNGKCNDTFPDACQAGGGCYFAAPYFVRHDGLRNQDFSCYGIVV